MVDLRDITGLVLAGGRGTRMGGVDKGLQLFRGVPLALQAMRRLAPQVAGVIVNANRHLAVYESFGMPVRSDTDRDYAGPLAGFLTGLEHCATPYLIVVPCDAPFFPPDLVRRLAIAMASDDAEIATAATSANGILVRQPVFCLLKKTLGSSLRSAIDSGQRKVETWTGQHRRVDVQFDDPTAFVNVNTLEALQRLQTPGGSGVL